MKKYKIKNATPYGVVCNKNKTKIENCVTYREHDKSNTKDVKNVIGDFTKACNDIANDPLLSQIKLENAGIGIKAEHAGLVVPPIETVNPRWTAYAAFKHAIDEEKTVMYVKLD